MSSLSSITDRSSFNDLIRHLSRVTSKRTFKPSKIFKNFDSLETIRSSITKEELQAKFDTLSQGISSRKKEAAQKKIKCVFDRVFSPAVKDVGQPSQRGSSQKKETVKNSVFARALPSPPKDLANLDSPDEGLLNDADFRELLNTWAEEADDKDDAVRVKDVILKFLKDEHEKELNCSVSKFPPIWRHTAFCERLNILSLHDADLTSIPQGIGSLRELKVLRLYENSLEELPAKIGDLRNLEVLELGDNALKRVPPEIGNLSKLTHLHLDSNKLECLPVEIGKLTNLKKFQLFINKLRSLPQEILNLPSTCEIDIDCCGLSTHHYKELQDIMRAKGYSGPSFTWEGLNLCLTRQENPEEEKRFEEIHSNSV